MIPDPLRLELEEGLAAQTGAHDAIVDTRPVAGGCISNAMRVRTASGQTVFLKWTPQGAFDVGMFAAEVSGLRALAETKAVRTPTVLACRDDAAGEFSWILLEWLEPGRMVPELWEELGRSVAALHKVTHDAFGWHASNFIGSFPQQNMWQESWPVFWREKRILPQLDVAISSGALNHTAAARVEKLCGIIDEMTAAGNVDGPSLLHGDLWSGNVHPLASGGAALLDPSAYYGHREVDLAMASLFGGYHPKFFAAYEEVWPLQDGAEERRMLYQIYYLLVHVNLFGGSYVADTLSVVDKLGF